MTPIANPRAVQAFCMVAQYGGITEAAKYMRPRVSPSTLSEQITELEEELHAVLFIRRPFSLTPAGRRLYEFSKPFFDGLDDVAAELRNGAPDMIRIGAWSVVLRDYLPKMLRSLEAQFPKLRFKLVHGLPPEVEKLLESDEIDLGITVCETKAPVECSSEVLIRLPLVLLVPDDSPLKSAADLWQQDRIALKLIAPTEDDIMTRIFRRGLVELGVDWSLAIYLNEVDVVETFVSQGYGVGLSVTIPGRPRPYALRELPLDGFPTLDISVTWRLHPNPVTLALLVELRKRAKELQKLL